jgi:phosphopentomutase
LTYGKGARSGVALGTRQTLSDLGQTVAENFGTQIEQGESFLGQITA